MNIVVEAFIISIVTLLVGHFFGRRRLVNALYLYCRKHRYAESDIGGAYSETEYQLGILSGLGSKDPKWVRMLYKALK